MEMNPLITDSLVPDQPNPPRVAVYVFLFIAHIWAAPKVISADPVSDLTS